jgi:DNA polymerase III epsilon subunit family exonuclease
MTHNLSPSQQEIVNHSLHAGHVLVIAGAGSGKTRVITERVHCLLVQQQVTPEQIVVMTFTERAADELMERLAERLESGVQGISIGTIHHICNNLLVQHSSEIGVKPGFKIYDNQRQIEVLRSVALRVGAPLSDKVALNNARSAISRHRQQQALALSNGQSTPPFSDRFLEPVLQAYRQYLADHHALDFDDLILHGLRLFDTRINPDLAADIHKQIRYVFVDEFHDLSPEQFRFLELLAPPSRKTGQVLVVADPNQAIYGFRDACAQTTIAAYRKHYRPCTYRLSENHRAAGNLVRAATHMIGAHAAKTHAVSVKSDHLPIDLVTCNDRQAEADWLAKTIKRAYQSGKYSYGDIALLYRTNKRAELIEATLLREDIPLQRYQEGRFFDDPDVQATIRYLSLIQALHDKQFEPALYWPRVLVDELTMAQLLTLAAREGIALHELARCIDDYQAQVSPLTRTAVKDFLEIFDVILARVADCPISIVVQHLLAVLKQRRSPFPRATRDLVKDVLEGLTEPLTATVRHVDEAIRAGRPIALVHDGGIDHAAGARILKHILTHYFQHQCVVSTDAAQMPSNAYTITLGQRHTVDRNRAGLARYTTRLRTLTFSVSVQAWRLGQLLLMAHETQRQSRFVVFDLETTGTHVGTTEILELAAIEVDAERPTGRSFERLTRPKGRISPAASDVHGITEEQVKNEPTIDQVLPEYLAFLYDVTLVGHNIEAFDYPVLHRVARTLGLKPPTGPRVDSYKLARRLLPDESQKLEALAKRFGYTKPQTHRALDDVEMNAEVFFRLLDLLDSDRTFDIAPEVLPLVAVGIRASNPELEDYERMLIQAGARALASGLGADLCDDLSDIVADSWEADDYVAWLSRIEHADPEEDQRWADLEQHWQATLRVFRSTFQDQSLTAFLKYVQLASTIDHRPGDEERITLMTIHGAKGKEWPLVFVVGTEDGTLPDFRCQTADDVEEERRVLYVAMTRAQQRLCLTQIAYQQGHKKRSNPFLDTMPESLMCRRLVNGAKPTYSDRR